MTNYTATKWSKKELEEFLQNCSSFNKKGLTLPKAMLDHKGNPIPLEDFMKATGQRNQRKSFDFSKTPEEKERLAKARSAYKTAKMREWKKVAKTPGYRNHIPSTEKIYIPAVA